MKQLQFDNLPPALPPTEPARRGLKRAATADQADGRFDDELYRAGRETTSRTETTSEPRTASNRDALDRETVRDRGTDESQPHPQSDSTDESQPHPQSDSQAESSGQPVAQSEEADQSSPDSSAEPNEAADSETQSTNGVTHGEADLTLDFDPTAVEAVIDDDVNQVATPELPLDQITSSDPERQADAEPQSEATEASGEKARPIQRPKDAPLQSRPARAVLNPAQAHGKTPQPSDIVEPSAENQKGKANQAKQPAGRVVVAASEAAAQSTESADPARAVSNPAQAQGKTPQPSDVVEPSAENQNAEANQAKQPAGRAVVAASEATAQSTESADPARGVAPAEEQPPDIETRDRGARGGEQPTASSVSVEGTEAVSAHTDDAASVSRSDLPSPAVEPSAQSDSDHPARRSRRREVSRAAGLGEARSRHLSDAPVSQAGHVRAAPSGFRSAHVEQTLIQTVESTETTDVNPKATTPRPASSVVVEGQPTATTTRDAASNEPAAEAKTLQPRSAGHVDHARFVQRVSRALQVATERGGQLRLRLSPPELGSMRLEITLRDGMLRAHLETETQNARTMLMESLPALRERLAEQGIKIERFDVDLKEESQSDSAAQHQRQADVDDFRENQSPQHSTGERLEADSNSETTTGSSNIVSDDRLNVIV